MSRADSPEARCSYGHCTSLGSSEPGPLLQAGGTSGSRRGLLWVLWRPWKPPPQPPSEEGEAFHQQAPAAPLGHSTLAPQLPPLVTMLSWGVLETLQAQQVICANPLGQGCGSGVLSSQSPSALSPQAPLPRALGLTPPGAHDALGLPDGLPALLQPCTPAASISLFPAPRLGQARVSVYLAGGRPSSQLVQPPVLWSGVGHGS